jgi:uncharacterized protein YxeA
MIRSLMTITGLLIFAAVSIFAQGKTSSGRARTECATDARIEFVRHGKRPSIYSNESDERVWLRLVNQSRKKTLTFDAEDSQRTRDFLKRKSKELGIYYEMVKKENCESDDEIVKEMPVGYMRREAYYTVTLKPGKSFVFSVARQHLSASHAVYLIYECRRKCGTTEKAKSKKAYFFASSLPKELTPEN